MTNATLAIHADGKYKGEMKVTLTNWIPELNFETNVKLRKLLWDELQRRLLIKKMAEITNSDDVSFVWTVPSKMNQPGFKEDPEEEEECCNKRHILLPHEQSVL